MSETTNYKLYLTDSSSERFQDWREKMNGQGDSNMIKIDQALSEKSEHSKYVLTTLKGDGWENAGIVMTQELSVEGLTEEQNGIIGVSQDITPDQMEVVRSAGLYVKEQGEGTLTIASDGETPVCDIPVVIILLD